MQTQKVETIEKTDFECGQINALNRIKSSIQKWIAEQETTTFRQLKVMSMDDDLFFAKIKERINMCNNIIEQIENIKEQI